MGVTVGIGVLDGVGVVEGISVMVGVGVLVAVLVVVGMDVTEVRGNEVTVALAAVVTLVGNSISSLLLQAVNGDIINKIPINGIYLYIFSRLNTQFLKMGNKDLFFFVELIKQAIDFIFPQIL